MAQITSGLFQIMRIGKRSSSFQIRLDKKSFNFVATQKRGILLSPSKIDCYFRAKKGSSEIVVKTTGMR